MNTSNQRLIKENLNLISENKKLRKENYGLKKLQEQYAKAIEDEKDLVTKELRRIAEIEKRSVEILRQNDELRGFLYGISQKEGKVIVHYTGWSFILDSIPELPRFAREGYPPPRMATVTRYVLPSL